MRLLIALILLATNRLSFGDDFRPFDGSKPIAVLIQTDPWAMVIGSDTPRCVIYEDHQVVFLKRTGCFEHKLSDQEFVDFKKRLASLKTLASLKPFYNLRPNVTDQPEAMFYVDLVDKQVATRVYGLMSAETKLPGYTSFPGAPKPDALPEDLSKFYTFLRSVDYPDSRQWTPKYIEAMIWPYEYAPDESIKWPEDWPALDSERTIKRGDSYSIFLDGDLLPRLQDFLRSRKEKGAVQIAGKKWALSYRYVFPSEPVWRKAFERTSK